MADKQPESSVKSISSFGWVTWLVTGGFILLAMIFYFGSSAVSIPLSRYEAISSDKINPQPLRQLLGDPPIARVNYYARSCQDCHQIFVSPDRPRANLIQHRDIVMDHGMNNNCYNCHDKENRNLLILRTGKKVTFNQVELLCSQCHGTTYRDWQKRMHGKTLGYWNATKGTPQQLRCSECHDPHAPAFDKFEPLPGPHTLRMGQPVSHGMLPEQANNPLQTWSRENDDDDQDQNH